MTSPERLVSPEIIAGGIATIEDHARQGGGGLIERGSKPNWLQKSLDLLKIGKSLMIPHAAPFLTLIEIIVQKKTEKPYSQNERMAFLLMIAYLESYSEFLNPEDYPLWQSIESSPLSESFDLEIKNFDEFKLHDAWNAPSCFHETELAKDFGKVLSARLRHAGLEAKDADLWTERVARNIYSYRYQSCGKLPETVYNWVSSLAGNWQQEDLRYQRLKSYLGEHIVEKADDTVLGQEFTFWQIYVPLKAKPVNNYDEVDLEVWASNSLQNTKKSDTVMFVSGGPGRGKTIFCRVFANWVRENLYPLWIPVLIRLRDIKKLQHDDLQDILKGAVRKYFTPQEDWLTDPNTKYLFLLDGFDELQFEGRTSSELVNFLEMVADFQKDFPHRVLMTGRSLLLQGIQLPKQFERVEIQEMDPGLQKRWFARWEKIDRQKADAFREFLEAKNCPDEVHELAKEPLLLCLLAVMHRDGQFQGSDLQDVSGGSAKIEIYNESLKWVLKQREERQIQKYTGYDTEKLERFLAEVGLCVVQSGGEIASRNAIESRLEGDEEAKKLLAEARKRDEDHPLRNALTLFYFQEGSEKGSVEFVHKSFGEFLGAKCIAKGLEAGTAAGEQPFWHIYDLLGYGALTEEIVEYLMALLTDPQNSGTDSELLKLFDRLSDFYFRWGQGEFIDADALETLPRRKMRQLREQDIQHGLRRVDLYAGLNVMIILLKLHRYAREKKKPKDQFAFHLCGKRNAQGKLEEPELLFRIIGYSCCIGKDGFRDIVGRFLRSADLSGANLNGADFSGAVLRSADLRSADLSGADLSNADLRDADLRDADLSRAVLGGANLSGADLSGANLSRAVLGGANLSGADLSGANLSRADLSRANLSGADLSGANLSGANLIRANPSGAYLSGAYLSGAVFGSADLSRADLSGADLSRANLSRADLSGVDLSGADLSGADLSRADLRSANLSGANLSGANLSGTDLSDKIFGDVRWDSDTKWDNVRGLEFAINVPEALRQQLGL